MSRRNYAPPPSWAVPGARVNYHAVIGGPPTLLDATIRSEPWQLGHGEWVISITGKAGGVSCQALSRVDTSTPVSISLASGAVRSDAIAKPPGARCHVCNGPATCLGAYDEDAPAYGCDEHCGHGCEDGECRPLADVPALVAKLSEWNDRYQEREATAIAERDAARAEVERLRAENNRLGVALADAKWSLEP